MRSAVGFLSITDTVCSPCSSRAASSEPTRPQPMITTCTGHLPVRVAAAIVSGLDGFFAPLPVRLDGFFAPPVHSRSMTALRQPDLHLPPAPAPALSRRYQSAGYRAKKLLLGPALKTSQLSHERVSKRVALAVFSSDPISSTAYATEEILLVLVGATVAGGALATGLALPVALAIVALLALLVVSYRQVVDAYPSAGGAYVVSRDNFGNVTAAVAGAALLIDYVLTVAVSVSSGVAAMASVWPDQLGPLRVELSVAFVVLLAWGNLRGVREAGRIFAIPTYVYVVAVGAMVVAGIWRLTAGDIGPISYPAGA